MKKRVLGRSGLVVSSLGLGCMGLTHAYGKPTEKQEAISFIRSAAEMGYTFFDTAEVYGSDVNPHENEEIVGEALENIRNQVIIATKFGIRFDTESDRYPYPLIPDSSPDRIRQSVQESLKRLKTDYIDLYFQHRIDPQVEPETVAEVMKELIDQGVIRHWGISEANEEYIRRAHAICPVSAIQNRYSMMARHYETLFLVLEELGIGFVAFSPLANGFLTARYGKDSQFDQQYDYRSAMPQFKEESIEQNQELIALITSLAAQKKATPAQLSLAWMMNKKEYLVPIPGTRKIERLKENAAASDIVLSESEVVMLDQKLSTMKMSAVFGGSAIKG